MSQEKSALPAKAHCEWRTSFATFATSFIPARIAGETYVIEAHEAEAAEAGLNATELHAHNCDSLILEHLLPFRKQI